MDGSETAAASLDAAVDRVGVEEGGGNSWGQFYWSTAVDRGYGDRDPGFPRKCRIPPRILDGL